MLYNSCTSHETLDIQHFFLMLISCSKELFQLYLNTSEDRGVRHRDLRFENKDENGKIASNLEEI